MTLTSLILLVVVLGLVLYLINVVFPLPAWAKTVINVLAATAVIIALLMLVGFAGPGIRLR